MKCRLNRPLLLVLALVLLVSLAGIAQAAEPLEGDELELEVRSIARELQCPVCQSVNVADSHAQLADEMRDVIRKKLIAGESREQILAYFVDRYGESILSEPPKRGSSLVVWLAPLAGLLVGVGIVTVVLRSWRKAGPALPEPSDVPEAAPEQLGRYEERVRRELDALERG